MDALYIDPHADPLHPLALLATGQSGADIERAVREARAKARRQQRPMTWVDIEVALLSAERAPNAVLDRGIAVHEIGHAVVYTVLGIGEVSTVRIGGRGGVTDVTAPVERLQTEAGLTGLMTCFLAGRAAEELFLGTVTIGSGGGPDSDLAKATDLAMEMEGGFGIGPDMPLLYRHTEDRALALMRDRGLAMRVNARLEAAYDVARRILHGHRDVAVDLATRLQEGRVMDGEAVRAAISQANTTS